MAMPGGPRLLLLVATCVLVSTTGCSSVADFFGEEAVLDTGIEPAALAFDGPTYMALEDGSLLVRNGSDVQRVPGGRAVHWLPDGNALADVDPRRARTQVVDPATGRVGPAREFWEDPSRPVEQLNTLRRRGLHDHVLRSYDLSLGLVDELELPRTDNPDASADDELERNYFGAVPTIDGVSFAKWHDGSESYDGDHGVLRIEGDEQENVLVNANIVGLYLSADGTGLLGLRQSSGDPCGGCVVEQDLVEIDPATGGIAAEYGVPDDYDRSWRVRAVDKVGGRVAVRFTQPVQGRRGRFTYAQRGTWVYDGEWTMVDGSDRELTWWQGEDRVVARVDDTERRRGDGFDLFWVHDGEETPLTGELASRPTGGPVEGSVAGQLLPPR